MKCAHCDIPKTPGRHICKQAIRDYLQRIAVYIPSAVQFIAEDLLYEQGKPYDL